MTNLPCHKLDFHHLAPCLVNFPYLQADNLKVIIITSLDSLKYHLAVIVSKFRLVALLLPLFIHADPVFALAGLAESSSRFHYNDFAYLERGHPSDICQGKSKWCLVLRQKDGRHFADLNASFEELNIPENTTSPYIIGRDSLDDQWLIYDLQQEKIIIKNVDPAMVSAKWQALGFNTPSFVNAHNTRDHLRETDESIYFRWSSSLQLWLILGVLPFSIIALLFWYLSHMAKKQYRMNASKTMLVFSYILFTPVLLIIYATFSSLIQIVINNW